MATIKLPASVIRCGTEQADEPGQLLTAGQMSVEFDNGQLRYLRVNGVEVVRAIGFLVRDENWGTYVPDISNLNIAQREDGFSISFHAVCQRAGQQIEFDAEIEGKAPGELSFVGKAVPTTDFLTARTGFVVLHPLGGVAGHPVRVEHVDGTVVNDQFPPLVDPVQPFLNIRSLTHKVAPGLNATVLMEGDTFEMEDHRNWTDASFKTYVRPLILPWPYTLKAGELVRQSVSVSLAGEFGAGDVHSEDGTTEVSVGSVAKARVPQLGLGMPAEEVAHTLAQIDLFEALHPGYLVCHFDPREQHGLDQLLGYKQLSEQSGAQVMLEVIVDQIDDFADELSHLAALVKESGLKLTSLAVVPTGDLKSILPGGERPPAPDLNALYKAARAAFPGIELGGGMFSFFTELNRKRVPVDELDYVHNTTCPIVHAADDRSVMETLEALPYQVKTAREFIGDRAYRIGPSGIGCRDNPHGATWTPNPENVRVCLTKHDPRQRGLFGAAWTLAYIATLVEAGVEAVSMAAPTGPLGVIYRKAEHQQPGFDEWNAPAVFPAYHVLRGLFGAQGSALVDTESTRPQAIRSLAYRQEDGSTALWIANLTATEQEVSLKLGAGQAISGVLLNDESFFAACTDPIGFTKASSALSGPLRLSPYAVAILSIQ